MLGSGALVGPSLDAVAIEPARAAVFPLAVTTALLAKCALVQGVLLARLLALQEERAQRDQRSHEGDRLLTAEEASAILGVTPRWLYRHARRLPFSRRLSRKVLRFSAVGLRKWQALH
jgi:hypothetical protein